MIEAFTKIVSSTLPVSSRVSGLPAQSLQHRHKRTSAHFLDQIQLAKSTQRRFQPMSPLSRGPSRPRRRLRCQILGTFIDSLLVQINLPFLEYRIQPMEQLCIHHTGKIMPQTRQQRRPHGRRTSQGLSAGSRMQGAYRLGSWLPNTVHRSRPHSHTT